MSRFLATLIFFLPLVASAATDHCAGLVPPEVATAAIQSSPGFRLAISTDNLDEDTAFNLSEHGKGCLGVATGDFDGNGQEDYLLALTSTKDQVGAIVVVLQIGKRWNAEKLDTWPYERNRLFVQAGPAGSYVRTEALVGQASGPGELLRINCKHQVAIFGATESNAVAYCRRSSVWKYVWVSD